MKENRKPIMEELFQCHPKEVGLMTSKQLREAFVLPELFKPQQVNCIYTHYDRMIVGGAMPVMEPVDLQTSNELKSDYFLERREIGIINIGGEGTVAADGRQYLLEKLDCLYLGRGTKTIRFMSAKEDTPAQFYLLSAPAHTTCPNQLMKSAAASPAPMGSRQTANERTIYKYIHENGIQSCQLVMGLTVLKEGSVWNTMPPHVHNRRMEVYLYFDVPAEHRVMHFMGEPSATKHLILANEEAVISAPWSIHSGCGTSNYSFIWGMAGENKSFADMDQVTIAELK